MENKQNSGVEKASGKREYFVIAVTVAIIILVALASIYVVNRFILDDFNVHNSDLSTSYTFNQKVRVFDGANWIEVQQDKDGNYRYYPTGVPDIVEFEFNVMVNEETPRGILTIKNNLPEGMEYINDSLVVSHGNTYDNIIFFDDPPLTSESRELNLLASGINDGGSNYFNPGVNGTVIFQARFLFDKSSLCKSVSSATMFFVQSGDYSQMSATNIIFESPCRHI